MSFSEEEVVSMITGIRRRSGIALDNAEHLRAVHLRQVDVQQDEIGHGTGNPCRFFQQVYRLDPIVGNGDLVDDTRFFQRFPGQQDVTFVVVY
jgi:hypothetical protein